MPSPTLLTVPLPPGWRERSSPAGPREFWATEDGSTGLLQVSQLAAEQLPPGAEQADLGALAAQLGEALGRRGQDWGTLAASKEGEHAFGRYGIATFTGGQFPAMLLCVTASTDAVWMWTWLGPSLAAPEVQQALGIVLESH